MITAKEAKYLVWECQIIEAASNGETSAVLPGYSDNEDWLLLEEAGYTQIDENEFSWVAND